MDVIVIGAGSAGSVVARRLADAGHGVTVLEAGGEDLNPAIHDPSRMGELWHSADDWDYFTVPQEHAAGRRLHLPRGKVLGGSHALNAMIWVRCAPEDYDGWAARGNDGWAWEDVRGVFEEAERLLAVTDDYPLDPIQESIVQAAVEEGLERNPDYNSGHLDGVSQQQVTLRDGTRWNTYMAYLKPVRDRVDVRTGCWVHRLLVAQGDDGPRVVGVEFEQDGEVQQLRADEVVLSAGALDSPRILLRSGIGPADELRAVGIEPVHDLPGVGRNLHDHLLSPVIFTTERPVGPPRPGVSVTQSHLFWRSRPELTVPDTQPIHFSVPMYQEGLTGPADGFSLMAGLVTPKARGRLTLTGPGPHDPVAIDLNALGHPDDVASLVASVRQCRSIGRRPALAAWGATEVHPGPAIPDDELEDYVRRTVITYHHQVGTCAMGVDGDAVVTPRLRVNGVAGITVADASVMPTITTGNTNAPAVLIAEQAARFLLADA